ncbi:MAG: CDGSH iron-sulfur domain-containing protein [Actinomycetales bacterium]
MSDAPAANSPADAATITVQQAGPLQVEGTITILDADGAVVKECSKAYLCRCGASKNKPFCDGSHRTIGFTGE